jgi:uncharacterized protein YcnI
VTVSPGEAPAGAVQRYCIRVPSEKSTPTSKVEVEFPARLDVTEVEAPHGWRAAAQKGPQGRIAGAIWQGGSIPPRHFIEFGVLARNPDAPAQLVWKAIQTYGDGSEVHWIGSPRAQFPAALSRVRSGVSASRGDAQRTCASGGASSQSH